jgi:putative hydrolases of HD superfamily
MTDAAKFVHRVDKLEMALQANQYAKQGYADKMLAPFFEYARTAVGDEGDIVSAILKSLRPASAKK